MEQLFSPFPTKFVPMNYRYRIGDVLRVTTLDTYDFLDVLLSLPDQLPGSITHRLLIVDREEKLSLSGILEKIHQLSLNNERTLVLIPERNIPNHLKYRRTFTTILPPEAYLEHTFMLMTQVKDKSLLYQIVGNLIEWLQQIDQIQAKERGDIILWKTNKFFEAYCQVGRNTEVERGGCEVRLFTKYG